jgi:hypothetical protein
MRCNTLGPVTAFQFHRVGKASAGVKICVASVNSKPTFVSQLPLMLNLPIAVH